MESPVSTDGLRNPSHRPAFHHGCIEWHRAAESGDAELPHPADLVADDLGRLLDDLRVALGRDVGTATAVASEVAALLADALKQDSRIAPVRGGLAKWQMSKIQSYIDDQLETPLRLADLASLLSLSASHFARAFKKTFAESPHAYIVRVRIERAQKMMLNSSDSLSEIALACGLVDQAHLCRTFRRNKGVSPGAWRRAHATDIQMAGRISQR